MIEKKELIEFAKLNGIKPWQQEKHYIQACLLEILADYPLTFKGGTYLWFAHGLPRFSEDLDFTANEEIPSQLPYQTVKSLKLFGIQSACKIIQDTERGFSFRISAQGPLNTNSRDECRVYVEISKRENILKKTIPIKLDFPAYHLPTKQVSGMNLEEVTAEKIRAILTRDKPRDVFDLYYLISKKRVPFNLELVNKKMEYYSETFSEKEFVNKLIKTKEFYEKELKNLLFDELPEFNKVITTIQKWVQTKHNSNNNMKE